MPAGALVRFDTFDEDTDGNDDLDLYLDRGTTLVANSLGPTSREFVQHRNTGGASEYTIYVHAFATDGPDVQFTLFEWSLGTSGLGTLAPTSITTSPGQEHSITLTGSGLEAGKRYLGEVMYMQGSARLARTLVTGKANRAEAIRGPAQGAGPL